MKTFAFSIVVQWLSFYSFAQSTADVKSIQSLCGCFEVTFDYAETFSPPNDYKNQKPYHAAAVEWVVADEVTPGKLVLQHLLISHDTIVIKHWREDWLYENTSFFIYDKDQIWRKEKVSKASVKGQWTQKVYEVNDGPRYEGSATWIHADGRSFWENTTDAPLPRREYTKRSDYQVMKRTNHHEITNGGFVHEQDNQKIIRSLSGDQLLVEEKGMNRYKKIESSRCESAIKWWATNRPYWKNVREAWNGVFGEYDTVALKDKVDEKQLGEILDGMGSRAVKPAVKEIEATIKKFVGK